MQGRRVELVRVADGREPDVDSIQRKRDVSAVFPNSRDDRKRKLVEAAKELGIIRDGAAFVSVGGSGNATGGAEPGLNNEPGSSGGHFDGSACLADTLLKQKLEKQEARDAAIKASKVPVYDDEDRDYLDFVEEAKQEDARQRKKREDDALAEFKRMQNKAANAGIPGGQLGDHSGISRNALRQGDVKRARASRLVERIKLKRQRGDQNSAMVEDEANGDNSSDGAVGGENTNLFGCYGDDSDE